MFNILVCEDDSNIRKLMCEYLRRINYDVFEADNAEQALEIFDSIHIDLLITDVMMPGMDGFELANALRDSGYELPILMITARETIEDKRNGFRSGTDDYMVKPFDADEMLLRVQALLRRAKSASERKITIGGTTLDYDSMSLTTEGDVVKLTRKEFGLLFMLLSRPGRIFTRSQIMDEIWGFDTDSDEQTVNVHIRKLREKLTDNPDFEIITVKGLGYKAVGK